MGLRLPLHLKNPPFVNMSDDLKRIELHTAMVSMTGSRGFRVPPMGRHSKGGKSRLTRIESIAQFHFKDSK